MNSYDFKSFFLFKEAIRLKDVKKKQLFRKTGGAYEINSLKDVFGKKDRLIYDIQLSDKDFQVVNPLIEKINRILNLNFPGFAIRTAEEYKSGIIYKDSDAEKKQGRKIGRLLASIKDGESERLLDAFKKDPFRSAKGNDYKIVISRHPYDIAGMSSDRNWTSCMDLGYEGVVYKDRKINLGINRRFVQNDIREGSIVAYLVSDSDRTAGGKVEVRRPLSRILMKPYVNKDDSLDVVYSLGRTYGAKVKDFEDFVENWLRTEINKNTKNKKYFKKGELYDDDDEIPVNFFMINNSTSIAEEVFNDLLNTNFDNSKYENLIQFSVENANHTNSTLEITFNIPKNVPLDDFYYERRAPAYMDDIIGIKEMPKPHYFKSIRSFLDERQIVVKYKFSGYDMNPDDEKGHPQHLDEYEIYDLWRDFFVGKGIKNINYKKALDTVINVLKNTNVEDLKKQEADRLKEYFENYVSENSETSSDEFKALANEIKKGFPRYIKNRNYIISLGKPSIEQFINLNRSEEYLNVLNEIQQYIKKYEWLKFLFEKAFSFKQQSFHFMGNKAYNVVREMFDDYFKLKNNRVPLSYPDFGEYMGEIKDYIDANPNANLDVLIDLYENQEAAFAGKNMKQIRYL